MLMTGECQKENRSKIKIDKWLGEPDIKSYEQFILLWKNILEQTREKLAGISDLEEQKKLSMYLLQKYYLTPYGADFFAEFGSEK